ncbi:hypothetical protein [Bacteroides sp.]|uniref:hypothetical protein n=1 Tax=Bacteroides sp. TaxID=29523 RepID=UPI00261E7649|nr:hypothetical protein [Bacteroides sp.]
MDCINIELKKGDHIWVEEKDVLGNPLRLRPAEVLRVNSLSSIMKVNTYVAVHYLDSGDVKYECVAMEQIKGFNTNQ